MPDSWATIDQATWKRLNATFLGSDEPPAEAVRRVLASDVYQPDSFTVAERLHAPLWLDPTERDAERWLHRLVTSRLPTAPARLPSPLRDAAARHVTSEVWRVLGTRVDSRTVAETLWNQEVPYLIDRVIGWCLYGDATKTFDVTQGFNQRGAAFISRFHHQHAAGLLRLENPGLLRVAVAAGLLGLDEKGGSRRCDPIPLTATSRANKGVWERLRGYANVLPAVDHSDALIRSVSSGPVHLVWWLDDLVETSFDLLLIQRLVLTNPRLKVTIVAKHGQHDNDASTTAVRRMLKLPTLTPLRQVVASERVTLSRHGPRMATANPLKLHKSLLDTIARSAIMVCKGGRIHEMFNGNIAAPMFTAYVVVRPFTEAQAGVDSTGAPLMIFGAEPGEWSWWGFQGRARRTLNLPTGRTVPVCHTTVAEHAHRARTPDPLSLLDALTHLVATWPGLRHRYSHAVRAEIRLLHNRIRPHSAALPAALRAVLDEANLISKGEPTHADRSR
ncbi:hypothetical protein [Actinoplanes couchii]|uniref:Uncharacterized protein n=1 Tax=Actinoplanes couchii TaxID=403638 RepID=A0ABQ3XL84_9ACTN|nr:hypothetical protein [Actinoplanes couchii]MDR6318377.1 hypothetical protein [Actinoplanes couchii]GID59256.1 hypothetical protein Aco03nite_076600 [Actinoplanes couchii]